MGIYSLNGSILQSAYSQNGSLLNKAYNSSGTQIFPDTDPYLPGRTIVFEDDFASFDDNNWTAMLGITKVNQRELQCYREENISFSDSCVVFTAKREEYASGYPWTSGAITSQLKKTFKYGRFDAKIKFPAVKGAFPAFWMLGDSFWKTYVDGGQSINHGTYPQCGEIDIVEIMPKYNAAINTAYANLWSYTGQTLGNQGKSPITPGDWHIYGLEWTDTYLAALFDGEEFKRWTFSDFANSEIQCFHEPFYMLLNLAVGGSGDTPAANTNEMKMYVDWVRVYAPLNGT